LASALHQFEIEPILPFHIGSVDLSFTNSAMALVIGLVLTVVFLGYGIRKRALVPNRFQAATEMSYEFVHTIVRENLGNAGMHYFPLIFSIFFTVLMGNALGLVPHVFTATSHIVVTGALAVMIFLMVVVLGIARHGTHFFSLFVPAGVPVLMLPLIVPLEVLSFVVRPITLSVRLFANMMAGHVLLTVIAGFAVTFLSLGVMGGVFGILPTLFNVVLIGFELVIAFLQAYVFTILCCIYLKDTVELAH
jgi:F-type H+-transporting ATPase subunit a